MLSVLGTGKVSPGTAKTAVESIKTGTQIRRDGKIVQSATSLYREIDFGQGLAKTIATSWGDVATAFYTTGIPNITVYFQANPQLEELETGYRTPAMVYGIDFITEFKGIDRKDIPSS